MVDKNTHPGKFYPFQEAMARFVSDVENGVVEVKESSDVSDGEADNEANED